MILGAKNALQHVLPTIRNGVLQLYAMVCSNYTGTSQAMHEGMRMITADANINNTRVVAGPISPSEPPGGVGPGVCTLGSKCY